MRYVLVMLGSLVGLVIVAWLLLCLLISVGCIYPANYAEQKTASNICSLEKTCPLFLARNSQISYSAET